MKTKPLNNNCLIEVIREDDGVARFEENESLKRGRLVNWSSVPFHITASSGFSFSDIDHAIIKDRLDVLIGKIVRWEEHADAGQTFEEDGKTYALIPWWRLISYEEEE